MSLKTNTLLIVMGTVFVGAIPAGAQIAAPREAAQAEFGPVALYPTLQLVDVGIDENVFNDGSAPQRDYTMTVATKVLAVVRLGTNELLFRAGSDYVWFQEFTSERSNNAQYAMRFNLSASRFKPFTGAEYVRTRARRTPEIDVRARRTDRIALGGFGFDLTPRTALTATARLEETTYDEGEQFRGVALDEELNRTGRGGEAGVKYSITPLTTITVAAGYEEQTFRQSHIRDLKRYTVGPTIEFSPEAMIRGRVVTAFELFKPKDPSLAERMGVAYTALLNWTLYGRTTFDLGAGRNVSYSYQDTEPYYLLTSARLLVSHPLPGRFELYGGGDWEHMAYRWRRGAAAALDQPERVDTVAAAHGGAGVRIGRSFHLRVGVEKTRRRSVVVPEYNFTRTRILSTVTVGS
jgi:Putative beta-barrel porin 2